MDKVESAFLVSENTKPLVWMRYIDDMFFIWTESKNELELSECFPSELKIYS